MKNANKAREEARKKAFDEGQYLYNFGEPCKYGHIAPRYVSNSGCTECQRLRYPANRKYVSCVTHFKRRAQVLIVLLDPRDLLEFSQTLLRLAKTAGPGVPENVAQPTSKRVIGHLVRYRFKVLPEHRLLLYNVVKYLNLAREGHTGRRLDEDEVDQIRKDAHKEAKRTIMLEEMKARGENIYPRGQGPKNPFN